jgi:CheY-like chemotaxis protein
MIILIVEDEFLIAEDLKNMVEDLGHAVIGPVFNCAAALEAIWNRRPDLAFIDTELGSETCEAVVSECRALDIPMIITSGYPAKELQHYCLGLPYLGKPFGDLDVGSALAAFASSGLSQ